MDSFIRNTSCILCMSLSVMFTLIIVYFVCGDSNQSTMLVGICIMAAISSANMFCLFMNYMTSRHSTRGQNTINTIRVIEDTIVFTPTTRNDNLFIDEPTYNNSITTMSRNNTIKEYNVVLQEDVNIGLAVPVLLQEENNTSKDHIVIVVQNP